MAAAGRRQNRMLASARPCSATPGRPSMPAARRRAMALAWRALRPQIAVQIGLHLRRQQAHLENRWPPRLRRNASLGRRGIEQHDGLRAQRAVLGGAEGQRGHARLPGHLCRAAIQADQRVGEARAVHVQRQSGVAADGADGAQLVQRETPPVSVAWVTLTQDGCIECTSPALRRASTASWAGRSWRRRRPAASGARRRCRTRERRIRHWRYGFAHGTARCPRAASAPRG